MSLDTQTVDKLEGNGFLGIYKAEPNKWTAMVQDAARSARGAIEKPKPVLAGDVVKLLKPAVEMSKEFQDLVAGRRLGAESELWATWFAEYIIEQIYPRKGI